MAEVERALTAKGQPKILSTDPEYGFSLIGLIASFCGQPIVGLILSSIALKKSAAAGHHNSYALTGFIISIVMLSFALLAIIGETLFLILVALPRIHG